MRKNQLYGLIQGKFHKLCFFQRRWAGKVPTAQITVQAVEGGLIGNVAEDAIKLMVNPLNGIALLSIPAGRASSIRLWISSALCRSKNSGGEYG